MTLLNHNKLDKAFIGLNTNQQSANEIFRTRIDNIEKGGSLTKSKVEKFRIGINEAKKTTMCHKNPTWTPVLKHPEHIVVTVSISSNNCWRDCNC